MVIHKVIAAEYKGRQQMENIYYSKSHWQRLYNARLQNTLNIMNIKNLKWNPAIRRHVTTSYYFNPNKW